jgi:[protein-PII] uridylyltransferase
LLSLLAAGSQGWEALGSLWEAGWLTRALPEIGHVRGLAQAAPFHRYPVDAHLGATVAQVVELSDHGWTGEVADEIGGLDEVLLAAFLHDAGKGLAGSSPQDDHSNLGARLATDLLLRTGFGAAQADLVARAVRHHLILPDVALRRDIDDAKVIDEVALTIGDPGLLRILALLSIADLRATGPEMWSDWKDALIRSLYLKLAGRLAAQASSLNAGLEQEVELLTADLPPGTVTNHLALMPAPYLTQFDPVVIASHVRLAVGLPEGGIRSFGISATPASTFIVAGRDRPGLLATIAGVLALHNLNVLEARITTRSDGVAIDTFRVDDALGSGMVGQGRWPGVRNDLAAAASGEIDLTARLVAKRRDYRISGPQVESQVQVWDHEGARFIEVRATDRVGLLHDVASAVTALGLDVTFAKIDTRGSLAIDVFEARSRRDHSPERTRTELLRVLRSE